MFKRSLLLVALIFLVVFTSAFTSQMMITKDLPSSFDSGLTIEQAFKTSQVPLLVEFYSDDCGTCRKLTPVLHEMKDKRYHGQLTMVMLDVTDPANAEIAKLFGVDSLPGLFVFDHKHMKKHPIAADDFASPEKLQHALDVAVAKSHHQAGLPAARG
jgi:thioredoxin-like negative regulator of GroEL